MGWSGWKIGFAVAWVLFVVVAIPILWLNRGSSDTSPLDAPSETTPTPTAATTAAPERTVPVEPVAVVLQPSSVSASSTLSDRFVVGNLFDGDPVTSWQDDSLAGRLATITLTFATPIHVDTVSIFNVPDDAQFRRNYRIHELDIVAHSLDGEPYVLRWELADTNHDSQLIPVGEDLIGPVTLRVESTYPAEGVEGQPPFQELAIGEITVRGFEIDDGRFLDATYLPVGFRLFEKSIEGGDEQGLSGGYRTIYVRGTDPDLDDDWSIIRVFFTPGGSFDVVDYVAEVRSEGGEIALIEVQGVPAYALVANPDNPAQGVKVVGYATDVGSVQVIGTGPVTIEELTRVADGLTGPESDGTPTVPSALDLSATEWVVHGVDGVRTDDGRLIWATSSVCCHRNLARDGQGGLVFSDADGLWWFPAEATAPRQVLASGGVEIIEVMPGPQGPVARYVIPGFEAGYTTYVRLSDGAGVGDPRTGKVQEFSTDGAALWVAPNGMWVRLVPPVAEFDREGALVAVTEQSRLVVGRDGQELLDIGVGESDAAWARIHDFDGRNLIISRGSFEPAAGPETFFVIDLACTACTRTFTATAAWATLPGADSGWTGPVPTPRLGSSAPPPALTVEVPSGAILIATPQGVVTSDGPVLVETPHARFAVDDAASGLLIEQGGQIWRLRPDGSAPVLVVDADLVGGTVTLMDSALIDDVPYALYVVTERRGESVFPDVIVHNLDTGDTKAFLTEQGYEGGLGHVSYGGGVLSVANAAEGCTWFELVTFDGSPLPYENPFGGGCDRPEFPQIGGGALSPDGRTMVYLSADDYPDEDVAFDLVLYDLIDGKELNRIELPVGTLWNRVDFNGTSALVTALVFTQNRWIHGHSIHVDSVDQTDTTIQELTQSGLASFAN